MALKESDNNIGKNKIKNICFYGTDVIHTFLDG